MKNNILYKVNILVVTCFIFCSKNPTNLQNSPPENETITVSHLNIEINQRITLKITANDKEGEKLLYSWNVNDGSFPAGSTGREVIWQAPASPGQYQCVVTVSDGNAQSEKKKTLNVSPINMVFVPAGNFSMGSNDGMPHEKPAHLVYLDDYYIDKYEVTNAQYATYLNEALAAGKIQYNSGDVTDFEKIIIDLSDAEISYSGGSFVVDSGKDNYPVIEVTWFGARSYAEFYEKRLPTEAEWEKAARGTDRRNYPWGNVDPSFLYCNFNFNVETTTPVGTYSPIGDSPYGCSDMAGNVNEWCADWYDKDYYNSNEKDDNPQGPASGNYRVLRGGAYYFTKNFIRCSTRFKDRDDHVCSPYGFRCVKDR